MRAFLGHPSIRHDRDRPEAKTQIAELLARYAERHRIIEAKRKKQQVKGTEMVCISMMQEPPWNPSTKRQQAWLVAVPAPH
jgi:hypothetical protein